MAQTIILPDEMHPVDQLQGVRRAIEQLRALERLLVVGIKAEMRQKESGVTYGRYAIAFEHRTVRPGNINFDLMRADGVNPDAYRTADEVEVGILVEPRTGAFNG